MWRVMFSAWMLLGNYRMFYYWLGSMRNYSFWLRTSHERYAGKKEQISFFSNCVDKRLKMLGNNFYLLFF